MRTIVAAMGVAILLVLSAFPVAADWDEGSAHKMHYPQLPDEQGWDVNLSLAGLGARLTVADDWLCTRSGPVTGIHFWV